MRRARDTRVLRGAGPHRGHSLLRAAGALVVLSGLLASGVGLPQEARPTAPPVVVFASIEPDTATVGDRLRLRVRVDRRDDVEVVTPDVASAIAPLEILESAPLPPVEQDGRVTEERIYVVAGFETGAHGVPPMTFRYTDAAGDTGVARTDSTSVTIVSVLPADEENPPPRDIKPPIELPRRIWPFVLAAALAAGLLLAYRYLRAWWRRLRRAPEEEEPEPVVPPRAAHLVAFERLEALRRDDPIGRGEIERFYVAVTDIVRRYIRDRFAVDAIDMTTGELEPALIGARIAPGEVTRTIEYLAHADLAKFAKLHPDASRAASDLDEAWGFVERTRFRDLEVERNGSAREDEGEAA